MTEQRFYGTICVRKRKGKFQVHMLRQAKLRRQEEHAQEIEKAEQMCAVACWKS